MVRVYVPNLAEFAGMVENAQARTDCSVREHGPSYMVIEGQAPLRFVRRDIGARPAIWYSVFSGGIAGRLVDFGRDEVTLVEA